MNLFIYLFWHYTHSLQIMKIKKYFFYYFSFYLFSFGWGSGVEYRHFFFSTTSIDVYHMHTKVNSAYKSHAK